jgi:hypothetical protein
MSRRKIKRRKTRVRRPRAGHAVNADAQRRAETRAMVKWAAKPTDTDKEALEEDEK